MVKETDSCNYPITIFPPVSVFSNLIIAVFLQTLLKSVRYLINRERCINGSFRKERQLVFCKDSKNEKLKCTYTFSALNAAHFLEKFNFLKIN